MNSAEPIHGSTKPKRGRDIHEAHRVSTPLELLFDLVFVVAIALTAAQLHHGVMEHHSGQALLQFGAAFVAIWWAWMNYTWFASAYDNDDAVFRLLTMLQMVGVLVFATGIPFIFKNQWAPAVVGFAIMRLALVIQWLRAAQGDPPCRATCVRYAVGIAIAQLGWIARLALPIDLLWPSFVVLMLVELAVPVWAERASNGTPWHAHHIAERYSLMTIIVLGECVLGATNAVASVLQSIGWSWELVLIGLGGTGLVFSLWWVYFLLPSAEALHHHRERAFGWGYGHFFVFAALAAVGSGLEVVADVLKNTQHAGHVEAHFVSPVQAIGMVALAQGIFMVTVWALWIYATRAQARQWVLLLVCLACIGAVVAAVGLGLAMAWALPLLTVGPLVAIVYNEHGRRHREAHFAVR